MNIELRRGSATSMGTFYSSTLYDADDRPLNTTQELCYNGYTVEEIEEIEGKRHAAYMVDRLREELEEWGRVLYDD